MIVLNSIIDGVDPRILTDLLRNPAALADGGLDRAQFTWLDGQLSDALARLRAALAQVEIAGVVTNVEFLRRLAASRAFTGAELDTGLIERSRAELFLRNEELPRELLAAAAFAELCAEEQAARERAGRSRDPYSPWDGVDGWRLNEDSHHDFVFLEGQQAHAVRVVFGSDGLRLRAGASEWSMAVATLADGRLLVRLGERSFKARAVRDGDDWHVFCEGDYRQLRLRQLLQGIDEDTAHTGSLAAPMPGRIVKVYCAAGAKVKRGEPLLILEAMKMEHTIAAPVDGVIEEIHYRAGEQVLEGAQLITLKSGTDHVFQS